jgi:hypothetical protein
MAKEKLSDSEQVTQHIQQLPPSIQPAVAYLRQLILSIDPEIAEQIKWNSPAFYFAGTMQDFDPKEYKRDILVMNLHKEKIMCVLPTGARINANTAILEGKYTDGRRLVNFKDLADIQAKQDDFKAVVKAWLAGVER